MACARDMGLDEAVVQFVLPLATTVNMNGTALYEAVTVIFIAQVSHKPDNRHQPPECTAVHSQPASTIHTCGVVPPRYLYRSSLLMQLTCRFCGT